MENKERERERREKRDEERRKEKETGEKECLGKRREGRGGAESRWKGREVDTFEYAIKIVTLSHAPVHILYNTLIQYTTII